MASFKEISEEKYPDTLAIYEVSSRALPAIQRKAFLEGVQAVLGSPYFVDLLTEVATAAYREYDRTVEEVVGQWVTDRINSLD